MKLTIDFESRSACDLKKHGAHVYSEHPTTDILCMAMKWEGKPPFVVTPRTTTGAALKDLLEIADTIEAHNMSFEYVMWENIAVPRYGWPPLPMEKLRCSAANTSSSDTRTGRCPASMSPCLRASSANARYASGDSLEYVFRKSAPACR